MADTNLRQKHFSIIGWILWGFWVLIGWLGIYQHASLKKGEEKMPTSKEQENVDVKADQTASVDSAPLVLEGSESKNDDKYIEHLPTTRTEASEQKQSDSFFSKFRNLFRWEEPQITPVVPPKSALTNETVINFKRVLNDDVWIGKLTHEEREAAFDKKDWFRVLELVADATDEQIRSRRRKLLAWVHTDTRECTLSSDQRAEQREWIETAADTLLNPTDPVRRKYREEDRQRVQKGRELNQRIAELDKEMAQKDTEMAQKDTEIAQKNKKIAQQNKAIKEMAEEIMRACEAPISEDLQNDEILNGTYDPEKNNSHQSSASTQGTEAQGFFKRFSQALWGETTSVPVTVGVQEIEIADDPTNTVELDTVSSPSDDLTHSNTTSYTP